MGKKSVASQPPGFEAENARLTVPGESHAEVDTHLEAAWLTIIILPLRTATIICSA